MHELLLGTCHAVPRTDKNVTHWPKHVLVHYHFEDEGDILGFNNGLYVLIISC